MIILIAIWNYMEEILFSGQRQRLKNNDIAEGKLEASSRFEIKPLDVQASRQPERSCSGSFQDCRCGTRCGPQVVALLSTMGELQFFNL